MLAALWWFVSGVLWEAFVMAVPIRAALVGLFDISLTWRKEIAFWATVPLTIAFLLAALWMNGGGGSKPDFRIDLYQLHALRPLGNVPVEPIRTEIVIVAGLRNLGTPSIAEAWQLSARNGAGVYESRPQQVPGELRARLSENEELVFHGADALYEKAIQPVVTGGKVQGWLYFVFDNVSWGTLSRPGVVYRLACRDVYDKEYWTEIAWTGKESVPLYFPGIKIEKVPVTK